MILSGHYMLHFSPIYFFRLVTILHHYLINILALAEPDWSYLNLLTWTYMYPL